MVLNQIEAKGFMMTTEDMIGIYITVAPLCAPQRYLRQIATGQICDTEVERLYLYIGNLPPEVVQVVNILPKALLGLYLESTLDSAIPSFDHLQRKGSPLDGDREARVIRGLLSSYKTATKVLHARQPNEDQLKCIFYVELHLSMGHCRFAAKFTITFRR